jgi:hypothetical protein
LALASEEARRMAVVETTAFTIGATAWAGGVCGR